MLEKELLVDKESVEISGKVIQNSLLKLTKKDEDGTLSFKWRIAGFSDVVISIRNNEILKIDIIEK